MKFLFALLVIIAFVSTAQAIPECLLRKDHGPCKGAIRKYYFNSKTLACERFIYGGCYGNGNRFDTKLDCKEACLYKKE